MLRMYSGAPSTSAHLAVALASGLASLLLVPPSAQALSFDPKVDVVAGSVPLGIAIGDIDGDGKQDLVVAAHEDDLVAVLLNTGDEAGLSFAEKVDVPTGLHPQGVVVADLDNDGKPDVVTANSGRGGGSVTVLHNQSSPGVVYFDTRTDYPLSTAHRVAVGDLDLDGRLDLAVSANSPRKITVFRNGSVEGRLSFFSVLDLPTTSFPNGVAIGDINDDGKADILAPITDTDSLSVYLNQSTTLGSFSFAPRADFSVGDTPDELSLGDLSGDGLLEVVVANRHSNTVSLLQKKNSAGPLELERTDFAAGSQPSGIAIGDFDADGFPDVIVTNGNDRLTVLHTELSASGISLDMELELTTGAGPILIATGDVDGDGAIDVATSNHRDTTASVFRNAGRAPCCDYPVGSGECAEHPLGTYRVAADMLDPAYLGKPHTGEDWNRGGGDTDLGDPVCSIGDGEVVEVASFPRWSNVIVVRHELLDGTIRWSQYAHLDTLLVEIGDTVRRGQRIGTIGKQYPGRQCVTRGRNAGLNCAHLHFEVRQQDVPPDNWPASSAIIRTQYLDPTDIPRDVNSEVGFIESNQ